MSRKKAVGVFLILACSVFAFAGNLKAQTPVTQDKTALIKEILDVTQVKGLAQNMLDSMLKQTSDSYRNTMSQVTEGSETDNQEIKKMLGDEADATDQYRALISQKLDMGQIIEEVYVPLYSKYFTVDELQNLLAFYKSPTGAKYIQVTPQLTSEAIQRLQEVLAPKIAEITNQTLQDQTANIKDLETVLPKQQ